MSKRTTATPIPLSEVPKNSYRYGPKSADAHSRDGRLYGNDPDGYDVRVTDPEQPRAAKIMRAVLAALSEQGFQVGAKNGAGAEKDDVLVHLSVREKTRRQPVIDCMYPPNVYIPTGRLAFHAGTYTADPVRWDRVRRPLEAQIDEVVAECLRIHADAVDVRRRNATAEKLHAAEEAERRRRDEERRQAEARQDDLLRMARAWQDSNLLRAFADEAERVLDGRLSEGGRTWLETARREAEAIDPLRELRRMSAPTETTPKP